MRKERDYVRVLEAGRGGEGSDGAEGLLASFAAIWKSRFYFPSRWERSGKLTFESCVSNRRECVFPRSSLLDLRVSSLARCCDIQHDVPINKFHYLLPDLISLVQKKPRRPHLGLPRLPPCHSRSYRLSDLPPSKPYGGAQISQVLNY